MGGARGERFSGEVPIDKFIYGGWEVMIGGASAHYGVLDVGDNLWERVVMVSDLSMLGARNMMGSEVMGCWTGIQAGRAVGWGEKAHTVRLLKIVP